jgi:4-alpha-glucanotransferase
MPPRISLALAIHNHQPVGNFGWVLADVFEQAYEPMVAALERHPRVRLSLHYTGPLLEWLRVERPGFIERVGALAERGQVEILGGGYYEPVLASLPERDRIGQLTRMSVEVERLFGRRPRGAWLAERVWEPDVPTSLVAGGYEWTILDDAHFRAAAIREEDLWGPYSTDDQGKLIRVFGTEQGLRYRIPFREVDEVIAYLGDHATDDGERVGMMGDDGEKFGAWPTTWEHCWGARRWVDRFFEALEEHESWLATTTPSAWLAEHPPIGRVYIPTGSYEEMGQWALPPDESREFERVLHLDRAEGRPEMRWMRGAFWRNFQVKYREINDLHKQMLRTSDAVDAMAGGPARELALDHLYQGQSNDCYWHGLFGGIYINHMRLATSEHLIAAEDLAERAAGLDEVAEVRDLDLDGLDDIRVASRGQSLTIDLADGAAIGAWDIRSVRHALCSVMRRRPEAYHQALRDHDAGRAPDEGDQAADDPTSIHDIVRSKEPGLSALLYHDPYERRSGLVRFLAPGTDPDTWATGRATELGDAVEGRYELAAIDRGRVVATRQATVVGDQGPATVAVTKEIVVGADRRSPTLALTVTVENQSDQRLAALFGLEWTLMLLGGGGNPQAWLDVGGHRTTHDARGEADKVMSMAQGNDWVGIAVETTVGEPAGLWWAPVETISNSEAGFERVYQGAGILFWWPLDLAAGATRTFSIRHDVTTTRDRTLEEMGSAEAEVATDQRPAGR